MSDAPLPRPQVRDLPAYVAGPPPKPGPGGTAYKLSSNENPYPPLPGVLEAVAEELGRINRYPDPACSRLTSALAARLGEPEDSLALATGSVALIYQILQAFCGPGDEVVYAWRSFEAFPIATAVAGAEAVPVPLTIGARHDLAAMAEAVTPRTKVVLVCSPNNPTGPAVGGAELADFLGRVPARVLVVVDEAYREFVRTADPVDGLAVVRAHRHVVVLRTFSKAYGLAGLRVGYAVTAPAVAAAIRAVTLPFGVSGVAQAAALASLDREPELFARVAALVAERGRVLAGLRGQGWQVPDAQGNFVWLPLGDRAAGFARFAGDSGLAVRAFAGDGVRATVAEPAANDVLLRVAADFAR